MKLSEIVEGAIKVSRQALSDRLDMALQRIDYDNDRTNEIIRKLNGQFQGYGIIFVKMSPRDANEANNAQYDGAFAGEYNQANRTIIIYISPSLDRLLKTDRGPDNFRATTNAILAHEATHLDQHFRGWKKKPGFEFHAKHYKTDTDYLRDPQEIGAFANEIIAEIVSFGFTPHQIVDAIKKGDERILDYSSRFWEFQNAFKNNPQPYNKLRKYIVAIASQ